MTATKKQTPDIDVILPDVARLAVDGIPVTVSRLRAREFMALLRVLTRGLGPNIAGFRFDPGDQEAMVGQVVGMFVIAAPEAMDEFVEFVKVVVQPVDRAQRGDLDAALENPEVDTLLDVFAKVAEQEVDDFAALVGKARAIWPQIATLYRTHGK